MHRSQKRTAPPPLPFPSAALERAAPASVHPGWVMEGIADAVTAAVAVPIIGIGASAKCDGQVLVTEDMLGLFERKPRFVKRSGDADQRGGGELCWRSARAELPDRRADMPAEIAGTAARDRSVNAMAGLC